MTGILIPNFNGKELLAAHLPRLVSLFPSYEIVIVDDASSDGSVEFLKKNFPQIKVIEKISNSGFSTTVNIGFRAISSDLVILLNSDVLVHQDSFSEALQFFSDEKVFAVSLCEEDVVDGEKILRGRGIGTFDRGLLIHQRGEVNKNTTLWANGGASIIRKDLFEKLGGFDELYNPFYWEDIDLSYRALKSGYVVFFANTGRVEHFHNEGSIKSQYSSSQIKKISYRNQLIFFWKNITDTSLLFSHILWIVVYLTKALLTGDFEFISGFIQAVGKLPEIIKKRVWQKKLYTVSDKKVIEPFMSEFLS